MESRYLSGFNNKIVICVRVSFFFVCDYIINHNSEFVNRNLIKILKKLNIQNIAKIAKNRQTERRLTNERDEPIMSL